MSDTTTPAQGIDREAQLAERMFGATTPASPAPAGDAMAALYPNSEHEAGVQRAQPEAQRNTPNEAQPPVQPEHGFRTTAADGSPFDGETLNAYAGVVRDLGVAPDIGQRLYDRMSVVLRERQQAQVAAIVEQWTEQVRADPEVGGAALDENLRAANELIREFGTPELGEFLKTSGAGSAPELVRLLVRLAKARE